MKTLTETTTQKIVNFLNSLNTEISITDYVNLEDIDFENAFNSIYDTIQDNNGFDVEIIYYSNAIEYLQKNDPSLNESIELALEYDYKLQDITSEVLASLLASYNAREQFNDLETEINNFFNDLKNDLSN